MPMEVNLKFDQYGDADGKTVIYFHGAPGSPEECAVFDEHAKEHRLKVICFDRFSVDSSVKGEDYYKYLARVIEEVSSGKSVDIIGFSIGCHAAIKTCTYLGKSAQNLHLVSAAAPLECGDYLDEMAGKVVFSIAMKQPIVFKMLSYWQALLSKAVPAILYKMLFASAAGEDLNLSKTKAFQDYISSILSHCFNSNTTGYIREINQYVTPWSDAVLTCRADTHIWQGSDDNWSPVGMAAYLHEHIPAKSHLELMEGLSHYSCLYAAAPKICARIAEA